ncbi:3-methyl-2-oxobutanoate hydroxymethyltransferase, partial [Candidatus Bipolaricaulota bacterium]|nr:3-methyl-2-oxobutanoate hydroxymethyltransferase [Candidatus Bipolaricaulota bacterium]
MSDREKININYLYEKKEKGEKISWLTAYDYPTALYEEKAGIEMILVGDSGGMTLLGYDSTLPVSMDEMTVMTKAVTRATDTTFVVGDMPYMSYQPSDEKAIESAGRFMGECGTDAVKLEGGRRMASRVEAIVEAGIPVIGHIGMTPQSAAQLGGYKSQGKDAESARELIADAKALEDAGAFAVLLEAIPERVGRRIYEEAEVPIYGIGAGGATDGQLLIVQDILGLFELFKPKFVKR